MWCSYVGCDSCYILVNPEYIRHSFDNYYYDWCKARVSVIMYIRTKSTAARPAAAQFELDSFHYRQQLHYRRHVIAVFPSQL